MLPDRTDPLTRGQRADEAARIVLRRLFAAIRANEEGTRRGEDPEFLHDFRVAVRRTRSLLGQVPGLFPARSVVRFRRDFRWLQRATGPARDIDVALERLPAYARKLPKPVRRDLKPLRAHLEAVQREERARMVAALDRARYSRLLRDWQEFLGKPLPARSRLPRAMRPIEEVARERIRRCHARFLRKGADLEQASPPERLHELRIQGKKLRYLLEFFGVLFEAEAIRPWVRQLKRLQDDLGEFNDFAVQQENLRRYVDRMTAQGDAPASLRSAVGLLVGELARRQEEQRQKAVDRFRRFASPENLARAASLFGSGPAAGS